jgi:hypothetical protein
VQKAKQSHVPEIGNKITSLKHKAGFIVPELGLSL